MTTTEQTADLRTAGFTPTGQPWVGEPAPAPTPRRRVQGLQIKALPTLPNAAQWLGGAATLAGVYLQWGWAVTLIVGGLGAAVLGMLKEGGKI